MRRMDLRRCRVPLPCEPIEYHFSVVIEFRKFITVKNNRIFRCADNLHICFQYLRGIIFDKKYWVIVLETVLFAFRNQNRDLIEGTKNDHCRCLSCLFRFFYQHVITEMHIFRNSEIAVGIKERAICFIAFTVGIIPPHIPRWIRTVCVFADVVRNIGDHQLRFWYLVPFVILKVIVYQFDSDWPFFLLLFHRLSRRLSCRIQQCAQFALFLFRHPFAACFAIGIRVVIIRQCVALSVSVLHWRLFQKLFALQE